MLKLAARANIASLTAFRVTAEYHSLDDICDIGALVSRDFVIHADIAPAMPMVAKNLAKRL